MPQQPTTLPAFDLDAWRKQEQETADALKRFPPAPPPEEPGFIESLQRRLTDPRNLRDSHPAMRALRGFAAGGLDLLRGAPSLRQWAGEATPGIKETQEALTDPGMGGQAFRSSAVRGASPLLASLLLGSERADEFAKPVAGFVAGALEPVATKGGAVLTAAQAIPGEGLAATGARAAAGVPGIIHGTTQLLGKDTSTVGRAVGAGEIGLSLLGVRGGRSVAANEADEAVAAANRLLQERFPRAPKPPTPDAPIDMTSGPTERLTPSPRPTPFGGEGVATTGAPLPVRRQGDVIDPLERIRQAVAARQAQTRPVPGRVARETVQPNAGPDDTGLGITESVGGSRQFPLGATEQLPLTEHPQGASVVADLVELLKSRGVDVNKFAGLDRNAALEPALSPHAAAIQERVREAVGDTIPLFRGARAADETGTHSFSTSRAEAEAYAKAYGLPVVERNVPVEALVGPGEEAGELLVNMDRLAAGAPAPARTKPVSPAEWFTEWQMRRKTDMDFNESLPEFLAKKMRERTEGPKLRDLPGRTRKIQGEMDDAYARRLAGANDPSGEAGFIDLSGITAEDLKKIPKGAERLAYFSMLLSPKTQARNVEGGIGAIVGPGGLERILGGDVRGGLDAIKQYFSLESLRRAIGHFKNAPEMTARGLPGRGALAFPSRLMHALDETGQDALMASGLSRDEAAQIMLTGDAQSRAGKALVEGVHQGGPLARLIFPFVRTGVNIAEQGAMRLPGIGALIAKKLNPNTTGRRIAAQQLLGTAAAGAGYAEGSTSDEPKASRDVATLLGAYGVPYAVARAIAQARARGKGTATQAKEAGKAVFDPTPLPNEPWEVDRMFSPADWLSRLVPNVPGVDPGDYAQEDFLDPTIAKIPWLNDLLLEQQAQGRRPTRPTRRPGR